MSANREAPVENVEFIVQVQITYMLAFLKPIYEHAIFYFIE